MPTVVGLTKVFFWNAAECVCELVVVVVVGYIGFEPF